MQTSFRTTCILFAVAVALSVYAYFFEQGPPTDQVKGRIFSQLIESDFVELTIELGEEARNPEADTKTFVLRYEKSPTGGLSEWYLIEPFRFAAFLPRVEGIINAILSLERVAPVTIDRSDAEVLGPKGPFATVTFKARGPAGAQHVIEVGADHPDPTLGLTYYRIDGTDTFLSRGRFKKSFNVSLDELRERAVFPVPKEDAVKLEISRPGQPPMIIARRRGTEKWFLTQPLEGIADLEFMAGLLDTMNSWRIESFVEDRLEDPALFGFDSPRMTVTLEQRRGVVYRYEIADDPRQKLKEQVYIRDPAAPFVYAVKDELLSSLEKPAEEFRSRHLMQIGISRVVEIVGRVRVNGQERGFLVSEEKPDGGGDDAVKKVSWEVTDEYRQETHVADRLEVRKLIDHLRFMQVRRYLGDDMDPALAAILETAPVLRLELTLEGEGRPIIVEFFPVPPTEEYKNYNYIARRDDGDIETTLVITSVPDDLASGGISLRNRSLSEFELADISRLEIRSRTPGITWTLAQIEGTWRMGESFSVRQDPDKGLDPILVGRVARSLTKKNFRIEGFLPDESDLEKLELTPQRYRIKIDLGLRTGASSGFSQILIGASRDQSPGQESYGLLDTVDMPVLLPESLVKDLMQLIAHLDSITLRE